VAATRKENYMSKFARELPVFAFTPAADYSAKRGYLVTLASDTVTLNSSASVVAAGVILDGEDTDGKCSVAALGAGQSVKMKAGGAITQGALVAQHTDGTVVTDPAAGARVIVGRAMETAASGELIEVAMLGPIVYAS
jgi:hypothetical protein